MQKEIRQTWQFNKPPKDVWDYLTKPELLEQWLGKIDFKPTVGYKFNVSGKGGCLMYCEVLEATPFTKLSYSWKYTSVNSDQQFDSQVVWTLVPTKSGTELQLVHSGFTLVEDYISHNNGWIKLGGQLVELLNTTTV